MSHPRPFADPWWFVPASAAYLLDGNQFTLPLVLKEYIMNIQCPQLVPTTWSHWALGLYAILIVVRCGNRKLVVGGQCSPLAWWDQDLQAEWWRIDWHVDWRHLDSSLWLFEKGRLNPTWLHGKVSRGNPTVDHSIDCVMKDTRLGLTDIDMVFDHSKPAFHPSYDRVDSGVVLFCDGLILIQHAPVSLPIPWSRSIVSLETEVADESVDDPTYIDGSQLLGPVSDLGSRECFLAGDPDGRLQENRFSWSVRSHVGCFHRYGPHCRRPSQWGACGGSLPRHARNKLGPSQSFQGRPEPQTPVHAEAYGRCPRAE